MKALTFLLVLHIYLNYDNKDIVLAVLKKQLPYNYTRISQKFDNPNFIRDRFKHAVYKPQMPTQFSDRFRKPYTPAWMDFCDPYHCNAYWKVACGINRRQLVFKWFQSGCHIILNNQCAEYRGTLKYDQTDPKFCRAFVLSTRSGCQCERGGAMVCAVSLVDNRVTLFRDRCAMQETNCAPNSFDEYEEVDMGLCTFHLKEAVLEINEDVQYSTTCCLHSAKRTTTMHIIERIRILKDDIRSSLRNPSDPEPIAAYYESDENAPIQPISESDELKQDDKFKLKKTKTPFTISTTKVVLRNEASTPIKSVQLNERVTAISKSLNEVLTSKSVLEIFYRKSFAGPMLNTPLEWLHCSEHITPYLKGVKKEVSKQNKSQPVDYIVRRVVEILKSNVTRMGRAEKRSVMFQMSKMKIRLYSWALPAIRLLLDTIRNRYAPSPKMDFLTLKRGLINLIGLLNTDLSNTTKLLVQAKIFRPPCIYWNIQGPTKFVPGTTVPTPMRLPDDSVECTRRDKNNNCVS